MQIASGHQHSMALSDDGYVWAWGKLAKTRQPAALTQARQASMATASSVMATFRPGRSLALLPLLCKPDPLMQNDAKHRPAILEQERLFTRPVHLLRANLLYRHRPESKALGEAVSPHRCH